MTEQRHRRTEPAARIPEPRESADDGPVAVRVRPEPWEHGLERLPRRAERFLSLLDRSRRP
ncbi:hypothetical protein LQ327_22845 [Actinomycetospora endophytica]|uniref:Uncharacterized protein n=1 Tax=Actinomycetospora endophytica TaxID=2291215 RepID=A0ABS8PD78_9PSEU|nr:hypothetical protein [Actinomycetospora endophytica]MCD2196216.1 hypothetical protein [Actinomycetospora endophytica]